MCKWDADWIVDLAVNQLALNKQEKAVNVKVSGQHCWLWSGITRFMGLIKVNGFFIGKMYAFDLVEPEEKKAGCTV